MSSYVVGIPLLLLLLTIAIFLIHPPATATADQVECTTCAACDNPCGQYLSPPPPSQPTYPYYSPPPPPTPYGGRGGGMYYYPPMPPSPPAPGEGYLTPPPPNPILPYFPFYYHVPPPSPITSSESARLAALARPTTFAAAGVAVLLVI